MFRIANRGYIIRENYYVNGGGSGGGIVSFGGRWLIKKASLDFLLATPYGMSIVTFIAFPANGFIIPFGAN